MKKKSVIKQVLSELEISYKEKVIELEGSKFDSYIVMLSKGDRTIIGGIIDKSENTDESERCVNLLFFMHRELLKRKDDIGDVVNSLNMGCRYGGFTYDERDINYYLSIPVIKGKGISHDVFLFYIEQVIIQMNGVLDMEPSSYE